MPKPPGCQSVPWGFLLDKTFRKEAKMKKQQDKTARPQVSALDNNQKLKVLSNYLKDFPPAFDVQKIGESNAVWTYHANGVRSLAVCYSYGKPVAVRLILSQLRVAFIETSRSRTSGRHIGQFFKCPPKEVKRNSYYDIVFYIKGLWRAFEAIC